MSTSKRPRLGRGLDAMLPSAPAPKVSPSAPAPKRALFMAAVEDVHPNKLQPRRHFDDDALTELAQSIKELGVLEPILVREKSGGKGYEIIAGERRWRASQRAGLKEVPVFVRELNETEAFEAALVENLQREDLNPIETARAFQRLLDEHGHTQESVAERVGKKRSTVANALRLLKLPESVLGMVEDGRLSEGHGRAILQAPTPASMQRLARMAVEKRLSVRDTEKRARAEAQGKQDGAKEAAAPERSANVRDLEMRLSQALGTTVSVQDKGGKGHLEIKYSDYDHLDTLLNRLL